MDIFDEIFRSPAAYEPPAEAAARLQEIAARRPLRVLDLGANIGLFAVDVLSRYPLAEVTSYEPDPENIRVLERCAGLNGVQKWVIVQGCAMSSDGSARITAGNFADSYVSDFGVEVVGVDVLPLFRGYDYVKMDIEGSEWAILGDERWADAMGSVAVLALEWHERGCSAINPRAAAIAAVDAAGFSFDASTPEWHHGTIWGWRSQ